MLKAIGPNDVPGSRDGYVIRPKLTECVARLWKIGTTRETIPLLKLEARLAPNSINDHALAVALRPFEAQLRSFDIYLEHGLARTAMPDWAVGTAAIDGKSASFFLNGLLDHRLGPVIGTLLGASDARADLSINIIPTLVEPARLQFAVTDFDIGVKSRIS